MKMIWIMINRWEVTKTKMMISYQQLVLMKTLTLQILKKRKEIINWTFKNIMCGKLKDWICRLEHREAKI